VICFVDFGKVAEEPVPLIGAQKPIRFHEMKKNGRQLTDVMDLDEVYYDAGAYGRSYRGKRRDAGKKIIENEAYREC
jgi:hypothetical protein